MLTSCVFYRTVDGVLTYAVSFDFDSAFFICSFSVIVFKTVFSKNQYIFGFIELVKFVCLD